MFYKKMVMSGAAGTIRYFPENFMHKHLIDNRPLDTNCKTGVLSA